MKILKENVTGVCWEVLYSIWLRWDFLSGKWKRVVFPSSSELGLQGMQEIRRILD
jgi:hypothetical protein